MSRRSPWGVSLLDAAVAFCMLLFLGLWLLDASRAAYGYACVGLAVVWAMGYTVPRIP